ncbi:MAG: GNAT family N-acetyltransferase [Denitrovibrio sp.]|nr:MAG: GNAT family N-acetyltransferase [Denitrovibrio sp.]
MIRKAVMKDAKSIQNLVNSFAKDGEMLSLGINEIYEKILEFVVWEEDGVVVGCCALHPTWDDLAEIRSVAVNPTIGKRGIGKALVERSIETATMLGIDKVFLLTYVPGFFGKLGFTEVEKEELPKKIWSDCLKCTKFPDCDEIAMMKSI